MLGGAESPRRRGVGQRSRVLSWRLARRPRPRVDTSSVALLCGWVRVVWAVAGVVACCSGSVSAAGGAPGPARVVEDVEQGATGGVAGAVWVVVVVGQEVDALACQVGGRGGDRHGFGVSSGEVTVVHVDAGVGKGFGGPSDEAVEGVGQ